MNRTRSAVTLLVLQAVCTFLLSHGAAADRVCRAPPEPAAVIPSADCPYIAKVCALISDPSVRNYVGFAEYAWDFNAAERANAAERVALPSDSRLALADGE